MKQFLKCVLISIIALIGITNAKAQITTSSLGGTIVDENKEAVIGAAVIATHLPSGTSYATITNIDGNYSIQGMRTGGPYKIEISSLGLQPVKYTEVYLKLGEQFNLNVTLKPANENLKEAVVIATTKSAFSSEKTGASTNISNSQIQNLPNVSRSVSGLAQLSPYGGSGFNFAGSDGRSANFTVDGANFNNNFGLSSSLPGGGSPISLDALEEIQVVVSPYDVRQTNFIGGGINAITKSGTNRFKGTAYTFYRSENLTGNRINDKELSERAIDRHNIYGFTLGGPIVKNKLFFFVNAEYETNPSPSNLWRPSKDGKANVEKYISRTTKSDMDKVSDFLKKEYGYDAGSYNNYSGKNDNLKLLARIDWNINDKHHLALRFNYTKNESARTTNGSSTLAKRRLQDNRLSDKSMAFSNSAYSMTNEVKSLSFDLNSRFNEKLSNQLLVTVSDIIDGRSTPSKPFPFVDIMAGTKVDENGKTIQILEPYMSTGYELFSWHNAVRNFVINAKNDITYFTGNHKIMAGLSFEYQMALNSFMRGGSGYYRYRSMDDFLNKRAPETIGLTYGYNGNPNPASTVRFSQVGFYIQDNYTVTENFILNAGIRFDTIIFDNKDLTRNERIYALDFNGKRVDTGKWPRTNIQISPRLGFTWDVYGNKTLKVRGGTGIFTGRLPLVYFTNMPTNADMLQKLVSITTDYNGDGSIKSADPLLGSILPDGKMITDPNKLAEALNKANPTLFPTKPGVQDKEESKYKRQYRGDICGIDPNFRMPKVWKTSLAVDYQLPTEFPLAITGEFIFNKTIDGVCLKNWSIDKSSNWARLNGPDNRFVYPDSYRYTNEFDGKDNKKEVASLPNAYVLSNTNKGYGYTFNVTVNAEPIERLRLMAAYTYTTSKEVSGMPGNQARSVYEGLPTVYGAAFNSVQNSQYVIPHRFIASVSYSDNSHNSYSLFYECSQQRGFSYVYNGDLNGDGIANDLIYIPKSKDELRFVSDKDRDMFWNYVQQDKYLSSNKGKYAEAYSVYSPFVHRFDIKYTHDFVFNFKNTKNILRFSVDCMNVGNLINSSWGVGYTPNAIGGKILTVNKIDYDGVPVYKYTNANVTKTFNYIYSPSQTWYMQIGLKYLFN